MIFFWFSFSFTNISTNLKSKHQLVVVVVYLICLFCVVNSIHTVILASQLLSFLRLVRISLRICQIWHDMLNGWNWHFNQVQQKCRSLAWHVKFSRWKNNIPILSFLLCSIPWDLRSYSQIWVRDFRDVKFYCDKLSHIPVIK